MTTRAFNPRVWLVAVAAIAMIAALLPGASAIEDEPGTPVSVIIRADSTALDTVRAAVVDLGATVTLDLSIIDGFAADLPAGVMDAIGSIPGVLSVTEDSSITLNGRAARDALAPPMTNLTTEVLDVDNLWKRGITGSGVGVALIDSGVTPVGGLDGAGKLVQGPDLSFDSEFENLRTLDAYGHGTHLAGIIAGADPSLPDKPRDRDVRSSFAGVAPGAHIVNVKVADGMGTADVSQVIAGIQWVVEHRNDPQANIGVLALAFGTDSTQDYRIDPLSYAVEAAWHSGLVVVVAAGNDGAGHALRNPASDPYVISVGAVDPKGTWRTNDDHLLDFSNCGVPERSVDVLAPGRSISSLRVPGSFIDTEHPEAAEGERYFRGTGTSQATAVTAGIVALMLDARPDLTPDQVKALLTGTAERVRNASGACAAAGMVNAKRAVGSRLPRNADQTWHVSDGSGSLEAARGSYHVYRDGEALVGEIDVTGTEWAGGTWSGGTWSGGTWSGGTWSGGTWSGGTWSGGTWSGGTWSGGTWSSGTWSVSNWQ